MSHHHYLPDGSIAGPAGEILLKRLNNLYDGFNITMLGENEARVRAFLGGLQEDLKRLDSQRSGPVSWVKGSIRRPPEGVNSQLLNIRPVKIVHKFDPFPYTYTALIYMGKNDGGLRWHWYDGPHIAWNTKISDDQWDKIEWLDESGTMSPTSGAVTPEEKPEADNTELIKLMGGIPVPQAFKIAAYIDRQVEAATAKITGTEREKQQAIAFDEWKFREGWRLTGPRPGSFFFYRLGGDLQKTKTNSELYDLFIQSQQPNQP